MKRGIDEGEGKFSRGRGIELGGESLSLCYLKGRKRVVVVILRRHTKTEVAVEKKNKKKQG